MQSDPPLLFLYVRPTWAESGDDDDDTESCLVLPNSTILDLKVLLFNINMISPCQQRLYLDGHVLHDDRTVEEHGLQTGSVLSMRIYQRGGKPVIYLFPPVDIPDVQVQLSLVRSWKVSAVYPPTPVFRTTIPQSSSGQSVIWTIDAKQDGSLRDQRTGRAVSYLFWEAL